MSDKPIFVTKPFLPPLNEYHHLLEGIWERGILTHNGPLVQQFEIEFKRQCKLDNFVAVSNGTIALQLAIRALELKGEIITTPFTWVATISAIIWEYCTPVFVDIDPDTLNIDPERIEERISSNTVAIMPVHVFGNACEVDRIDHLASKYGLKVIYDAAHAVGVNVGKKALLDFGDISAVSFHATKLLNTAEGGGCVTTSWDLHEKLTKIRFFGHDSEKQISETGMNGKMTEVHAALGIASLRYFDAVLADRKRKYKLYKALLSEEAALQFQKINPDSCNHSYFPVIFETEEQLLKSVAKLNTHGIFPRRYFYPSVNTFSKVLQVEEMPISESVSKRIVCLPLYFDLSESEINRITEYLISSI